MERRQFIKSAGLATAVLGSSGLWSIAKPANQKFKVGIIGFGDRGSGIYNTITKLSDKFEVIGICDELDFRLENAKKASAGKAIVYYKDYRKLLEDRNVDVVIIATPLYLHYQHGKATLEAGKHLFLEKTMTFQVDQALDLVKISHSYPKQIVQIGHQYRYSPLYFKVKDYIQKGYLGKVTSIDARWDRNWNWRRPVHDPALERKINWRMYKDYSGGLVAELLSHQMDFIHWAFETNPSTLFSTGGIDFYQDGRETFDNVQLTVRYEDQGMVGNFGATCANQHEGYSFKIKGSKGMINLLTNEGMFYPEPQTRQELEEVDGVSGATPLIWASDKKGIQLTEEPTKDGTIYALEAYFESLSKATKPESNVATGGKTAISVALANESLYSGEIKNWKPEYNIGE
ncbi:Gfo/Idh/MocA family oxidoreductase [Algoriphagus aestuariicola]|uniref:Gfo/Idh/MocA family oxidoreductase n=1 Tax=Algoriphagus aestuariicola TaxID=1852016 RepID=A0ABS3BQK8_9BACT|nr:Gfo/Idh/MocA family oxidoreductase [Algoriphagus aestuariicola]MBN7801109.1 Gfo/Idh/MocA family oxidoreductase [Algoriphagus aestuariicola]